MRATYVFRFAAAAVFLLPACQPDRDDPWPLTTSSRESRDAFLAARDDFHLQRMTAARAGLETALEADPELAVAHAYRALSMNYTGKVAASLRRARELGAGASEVERLQIEALEAWHRGDQSSAVAHLSQALETGGESARGYLERGIVRCQIRSYGAAAADLEKAVALAPGLTAAHLWLARARGQQGRSPQALEAIEAAGELSPDLPLVHHVEAEIHRQTGEYARAAEAYRSAIALDQGYAPAYEGLAATLLLGEEFAEAAAVYGELCGKLEALPDGAYKELHLDWLKAEDVCFRRGMAHLLDGDLTEAAAAFDHAARYAEDVRPENAPVFYNALGRFHLENGRTEEAAEAYDRGLEVSRRTEMPVEMKQLWAGRYLHARARVLARSGRIDEALDQAERLRAMIEEAGSEGERHWESYHYLMGYIFLAQRDFAGALEELAKADQEDPFNRWLLASAYQGAGAPERALPLLEELARTKAGHYGHALVRSRVLAALARPESEGSGRAPSERR